MDYPGSSLDLLTVSQAGKEETVNSLFSAFSPAVAFGRRASTSSGLVWGYYGGVILILDVPTAVANGTLTLDDDTTCYIRINTSTGVVDFVTSPESDWPAPWSDSDGDYIALYEVTTASGAATAWTDYRSSWGLKGDPGETGPAGSPGTSNVETTTSRTLSAGDNGTFIHFTNAGAITLNMAGALGDFKCAVVQEGAGQITFAANGQTLTVAGGLTKTAYAGAMATIVSRTSGTFFVCGTLA